MCCRPPSGCIQLNCTCCNRCIHGGSTDRLMHVLEPLSLVKEPQLFLFKDVRPIFRSLMLTCY
ncbi:hypothetical protein B0T21DRAFT_368726 [Apiosordaria backusii]|uniref:Uncharacterized protein n=1 Tax=Apiosordaria backusii TaxID=314023 RepID=A0AA40BKH1_9PEZI|nr:hypothetical protein B0T21DRAFT_368726 [Apiosordaria backusii]